MLDPNAPRAFSVYSINHKTLKVRLYKVAPEDWEKFVRYMRFVHEYYEEDKQKQTVPPGTLVSQKKEAPKEAAQKAINDAVRLANQRDKQ